MHQVIHSTEGVIFLTVAQKGMKKLFYYPTQNLQRVIIYAMQMRTFHLRRKTMAGAAL